MTDNTSNLAGDVSMLLCQLQIGHTATFAPWHNSKGVNGLPALGNIYQSKSNFCLCSFTRLTTETQMNK